MKWDAANYRKETLASILKAHADDNTKFKNVRVLRDGVYFEMWDNARWWNCTMSDTEVDSLIMELYG